MTRKPKFTYPLEPILLNRQWDLDALLTELGDVNAALLRVKAEIESIQADIDQIASDWEKQTRNTAPMPIERYDVITRYLSHLGRQRTLKERASLELDRARGQLIDRVLEARHKLDAIAQHHDEAQAAFVKHGLQLEYKDADEQWAGRESHKRKNEH